MLIKQLINTITAIENKIKRSGILLFVHCMIIVIGLIFMFLYSEGNKVNYIYNQF